MFLANVAGERTDFIRLNNGDVRQAGTVDQRTLTVDLIEGAATSAAASGSPACGRSTTPA